jgi:hypothetical protein
MDIGFWRSGTATGEPGFLGSLRSAFRGERWFLAAGAGYRDREFIDLKGLRRPQLLLASVQGGWDLTERFSLEASFRRETEGGGVVPDRFYPMRLLYSGRAVREWRYLVSSASFSRSLRLEADGARTQKDVWEGKVSRLSGRIAGIEAKGFVEGQWVRQDEASSGSAVFGGSIGTHTGGADLLISGRVRGDLTACGESWSPDWSWNGALELILPDGSIEARLEKGNDAVSLRLECRFRTRFTVRGAASPFRNRW